MSKTIEISVSLYTELIREKFILDSVKAYLSSDKYAAADEIRSFLAALGIDARYREDEDLWPDERGENEAEAKNG